MSTDILWLWHCGPLSYPDIIQKLDTTRLAFELGSACASLPHLAWTPVDFVCRDGKLTAADNIRAHKELLDHEVT